VLFPTVAFALFFLVVFVANWLLMPHRVAWKLFMISASYLFYAGWGWRFVAVLAASTLFNHAAGQAIARSLPSSRARRIIFAAALAMNLGLLGWFKYYGFFASNIANTVRLLGGTSPIPIMDVVVPVGISFLTFRAISYIFDIYRGTTRPAGLLDFGVVMAFFPYLAAGPIVRAREFLPQLRQRRDPRRVQADEAFYLILRGLFKKIVLADFLARALVDDVFATPGQFSSLEVLFGIWGYAVQIYCDFSGYSDIAIGLALLLGFRSPLNFDSPYAAVSVQDFWRRWHMTLSRCLRDYLYIPLGGNRGSMLATYRNLLLTMMLGGLWHGADWTFLVWGGLHGCALVWEHARATRRRRLGLPEAELHGWRLATRRFLVFQWISLTWVFFRAGSLTAALAVIWRAFTAWGPAPAVTPWVVLAIALGIGLQYVPAGTTARLRASFSRLGTLEQGLALGAGLFLILALGAQGVVGFIYFGF
jgi:D-alanyl-lipoteichoic acid acyltransferase DltB (MBOAT superfamily)